MNIKSGRPRGRKNLTQSQKNEIIQALDQGRYVSDIAQQFNVSSFTIYKLKRRGDEIAHLRADVARLKSEVARLNSYIETLHAQLAS